MGSPPVSPITARVISLMEQALNEECVRVLTTENEALTVYGRVGGRNVSRLLTV